MFNTYKPKRVTFEAMLATCLASALIRIAKDAAPPGDVRERAGENAPKLRVSK